MKKRDITDMICNLTDDSFAAAEDVKKCLRMLRIILPRFFGTDNDEHLNISAAHFEDLKIELDILLDYLISLEECINVIKNNAEETHHILSPLLEVQPNE